MSLIQINGPRQQFIVAWKPQYGSNRTILQKIIGLGYMYEQVQADFNNVQLELLSVQEKLLAMEKGLSTVEAVIPKLLAVFYKVQVFSWKLNPYLSKLIKGIYISVAVILNHNVKQLEEAKLKLESQDRSVARSEVKPTIAYINSQNQNVSVLEFENVEQFHTPISSFQRQYIENLKPNDTKICKEFEQFIICVKDIEESSEAFFKSIVASHETKVQGVEFFDQMIGQFSGTKQRLSQSFEKQYSEVIKNFKDLLQRFLQFKQESSEKQQEMAETIRRLELMNEEGMHITYAGIQRKKLQSCTQSMMTNAHISKLEHQLQMKILELEERQKRMATIVAEVYQLRSKIDNQDIERDTHKKQIRSSVIAFNQLQEQFKKVCQYAASVEDHHMDLTDSLEQVSSLGLQQYVDEKEFSQFSMNFKVSLFGIFKKIVGKYSKVTNKNREKIVAMRRSTISEGNINLDKLFSPYKEKKKSMMCNPVGLPSDVNIQPIDEESCSNSSNEGYKSSKGKYVENMFKKSLGLDGLGSNQMEPSAKIPKRRLAKGSIRRLGNGFGWKNDESSNDDLNKFLASGMRNKLDVDGMIQNNIQYHKSMIRSRSKIMTPSESSMKYQESLLENQSKGETESRTNNIEELSEQEEPMVVEESGLSKTNLKPKTSSGFRRTIDEIIKKAAHEKRSEKQIKNVSKSQSGKYSTAGGTKRSSIEKHSRGSDENGVQEQGGMPHLNRNSESKSRNSFKSKKILNSKVNHMNVRFKEDDLIERQELTPSTNKRPQLTEQKLMSMKKLSLRQSRVNRTNTLNNTRQNSVENDKKGNMLDKKSQSLHNNEAENQFLVPQHQQTLGELEFRDRQRSYQSQQGSLSKNHGSSNVSYRRSSIIDTNEVYEAKKNKLLIGELKLILDMPISMINKRIRQSNSIQQMIREAEQLHLKRCGSTFCTHLLRFYQNYRKISKDPNKTELKMPTFSIGMIEKNR